MVISHFEKFLRAAVGIKKRLHKRVLEGQIRGSFWLKVHCFVLVTDFFITTMAMAVQEEPQRLERVRPISEVVKKLEIAEYAMQEYDWRWRCVVDNGIRAMVKWTRLMLSIRVVDLHEMRARIPVENFECVE